MSMLAIACALAAGLLAGLAFFGSLRWLARRLPGAGIPWAAVALVQLLRVAGIVALLWAAARQGPWTLLAAAAGVVVAREWLLMATRRRQDAR